MSRIGGKTRYHFHLLPAKVLIKLHPPSSTWPRFLCVCVCVCWAGRLVSIWGSVLTNPSMTGCREQDTFTVAVVGMTPPPTTQPRNHPTQCHTRPARRLWPPPNTLKTDHDFGETEPQPWAALRRVSPGCWLNGTHDNVALMQGNTRQLGKIRVSTSEHFVSIIRTSHYLFHNIGRVQRCLKPNHWNRFLPPPSSAFLNKRNWNWFYRGGDSCSLTSKQGAGRLQTQGALWELGSSVEIKTVNHKWSVGDTPIFFPQVLVLFLAFSSVTLFFFLP